MGHPVNTLEEPSALQSATGEYFDEIERLLQPDVDIFALIDSARRVTLQRFGRTIQLFAPLYLSNHCVSTCLYCGFSMKNKILRKTLTVDRVRAEAAALRDRGFRHILLVSGEHPKFVGPGYISDCIEAVSGLAHSVQVEVQAQSLDTYRQLKEAGCDGVVIYQETYDRRRYGELHLYGLKRDYDYRLAAPDRIAEAGIKNIGLGALLGLSQDWRAEVSALIAHAKRLQQTHWRTNLTVALPRLRPATGGFQGPITVSDREFVQAICVLRIALPEVGIVLSTREPARLRDALMGVGVTHMSAGSSTEPGGYTSAGEAEKQFDVEDLRPPAEMAAAIKAEGFDPVWKDWEHGI